VRYRFDRARRLTVLGCGGALLLAVTGLAGVGMMVDPWITMGLLSPFLVLFIISLVLVVWEWVATDYPELTFLGHLLDWYWPE
jgi:hypothetical protein